MKTHLLKLLLFIVSLSFPAILFAQETFDNSNNPREWYYNNLESATAADAATYMPGAGSTRNSSTASITITSASSLNNTKSYSTAGLSGVGYIRWNFFGTGASSVNLNTTNWEWEFDYKNVSNVSSADPNPSTMANSWKYWLITSSYNGDNTLGTYVTQVGTSFYLRTKTGVNSNEYFNNATIDMPLNNHTYQVRILRNTNGYFYIYLLDRSTGVTSTNGPYNVGTTYSTYTYSYLEAASVAADRFQWDNFNFYRPKLEFLPISGNGVSTSIYPGIVNAIPYAVNVNVRGDIYIGRLRFPTTTNSQALFADNSGALYKTNTLPLSIGTSTSLVTNIGMYDTGTAQFTMPTSEYYYSPGNSANGSPINVTNYFLVAQGRNPFYGGYPSSISFSVSNTGDDTYQSFYGTTGPYYSTQATSASSSTPTAATAPTAPTVTTATPTNVTSTSATVGGNISSTGNANVTDYGIVYSTTNNSPTTSNSTKFAIGTPPATGATPFSSSLTGLSANATYYIRAYATNSVGTSYGAVLSFTTAASAPTAPTASTTTICGSQSYTVNVTGGAPAGGTYNWFTSATGGSALQSAASASYTSFIGGNTVYYVSYTSGGVTTTRTPITINVNPEIATPLSSVALAYPFNNNFNDVSGNGNNATLFPTLAPTPTIDRYGNVNSAYNFNGSSQYLSSSIVNYDPQTFSLSLWFRTTTTQGGKLIGFVQSATAGQSGQFDRHIYMNNAGNIYFGVYTNGVKTIVSPKTYNDGLWHHVVVAVASNGATMYIDGAVSGTPNTTITGGEPHNGYWRIGGDNLGGWTSQPTSGFFNGDIDDVSVYYRALTAAEATGSNDLNLIGNTTAFCENNTITLTAPTIAGAAYSWVDNANSTKTSTNNPATFANATSTSYTLTVTLSGGCTSTAVVTPASSVWTWTGAAVTTAQNTASNWNHTSTGEAGTISNAVPPSFDGTETIIIPSTLQSGRSYPVLNANVNVGTLYVQSGASLNLATYTLSIGCNIYNSNNTTGGILYNGTAATLNWNGTVANQNYFGNGTAAPAQVSRMTINNANSATRGALTISGGSLDVYNLLTLTRGNLVVATSGTFTLKSNAAQTANVAIIATADTVKGNVRVERYFTGGSANSRGYRLLSSPVSVSAASKILPNLLYLKDNAYLTGTGGQTNGFDVAGNPTLYFYRENLAPSYLSFLTSNFRGVKTINTGSSFTMDNETPSYTLPAGNGFLFFFRGNRASNATTNTAALANTATFVSSGYLNQGDVTVTHWYTGGNLQYNVITGNQNVRGFNLVGNPYASSIDWDGAGIITSSSISSTIWVYNPQRKIYATYIKGSGGVGTNFNGGAANIIPSGQGFMVRATSNSPIPSVKFTEAAKVATQVASTNLLMSTGGATSTTQLLQYMRLELSKDSLNREDALVFFRSTSKDVYVNNEDAEYLRGNNTLTMSTLSSDRKDVAINSIPYPKANTTVIPVNSNISVSGLYQINLTEAKNIPDLYEVYLIDMLKKDSLDILRNKTYNFNAVAGDSTTFGNKRFKLVIRQKASMALRLLDFSASKVSSGAQLDWTTENERDYTNFTVERSTDGGKTFDVIGGFASADKGNYFLIDKNPINGLNQYRLKQDDVNGAISYSKIVNFMYSKTAGSSVAVNNVAVFPNPATTTINVGITEQANSPVYAIRITDGLGMVVRSVTTTQTTWQTNISGLLPGTYFVQVTNNTTKAIVGNGKFIKQ